jgi:transcriptional regulator NrdR family protein
METREAVGGTRRRRLCTMCGRRWTTLEINTDNFAALVERGTEAAKLIAMFKNIVKEDE